MPHIIIEKSSDISSNKILDFCKEIQEEMAKIKDGNFSIDACKARFSSFDKYLVGKENHESANFFHITIKILEGRNLEIRKELSEKIAKIAQNFLKTENLEKSRIDLSVDIVDMNKDCYQKITL